MAQNAHPFDETIVGSSKAAHQIPSGPSILQCDRHVLRALARSIRMRKRSKRMTGWVQFVLSLANVLDFFEAEHDMCRSST